VKMEIEGRIEAELEAGEVALGEGNLGRARVCARRAAGLGIRAWYQRQEGPGWGGDAMTQLVRLRAEPAAPRPVRQAAERLTTKVDRDHQLPFDNSPIEDARRILAFVTEPS
jgi:hypothetical protein